MDYLLGVALGSYVSRLRREVCSWDTFQQVLVATAGPDLCPFADPLVQALTIVGMCIANPNSRFLRKISQYA